MQRSWLTWAWSSMVICSAIAAGIITFIMPTTALRPLIVFWFLFICPGMVLVAALRIRSILLQIILAFALSIAIDAIVASIVLYAGRWSPSAILGILIAYCILGTVIQLISPAFNQPYPLPRLKAPGFSHGDERRVP